MATEWNVCTRPDSPTILIPVGEPIPDGYEIDAVTSNPNYICDIERQPKESDWVITKLAFRNRFTIQEKIAIDLASIDNPAADLATRSNSAALRSYLKDLEVAEYIHLKREEVYGGLVFCESVGLIGTGRASIIYTTPPTDEELYVTGILDKQDK